jgi:hypothetical protein
MKYLEKYNFNRIYYHIPYNTESLIKLAINKLQIPKTTLDKILACDELFENLQTDINCHKNVKGCFIVIEFKKFSGYWIITKKNSMTDAIKFFKETNDINGGVIKLEDWEISANKYNL